MTRDFFQGFLKPDNSRNICLSKGNVTAFKYAFLSLAIALALPSIQPPGFAEDSDAAALSKIEQRLFFKDYAGDSNDERLARIEKQIFGETYSGSVAERLTRVSSALPPVQQAPPMPPPAQAPVTRQSTTEDTTESQEDKREKQRMAALAARDEEVAKLLEEGVAAWRARRGPQAIAKFEQVVRLDPQNAQAYYSLAVALEAKGEVMKAKEAYAKAAELEPDNKEYAQSAKTFEKHASAKAKTAQKEAEIKRLAEDAQEAYKAQEYISALDLYKQLDQAQPNQALTKYNIGSIYMTIKKPVSALDWYEQALKLNPHEPKYQTAVQQLKANIDRDDKERQDADAAWENQQPQHGGNSAPGGNQQQQSGYGQQPHNGSNAQSQAQKTKPSGHLKSPAEDPLGFYGMTVKNSGDGVRITEVSPGSRTAQVGLKPGDIVKAMDGTIVTNVNEMKQMILAKPMGTRFQLSVQRDQKLGNILY